MNTEQNKNPESGSGSSTFFSRKERKMKKKIIFSSVVGVLVIVGLFVAFGFGKDGNIKNPIQTITNKSENQKVQTSGFFKETENKKTLEFYDHFGYSQEFKKREVAKGNPIYGEIWNTPAGFEWEYRVDGKEKQVKDWNGSIFVPGPFYPGTFNQKFDFQLVKSEKDYVTLQDSNGWFKWNIRVYPLDTKTDKILSDIEAFVKPKATDVETVKVEEYLHLRPESPESQIMGYQFFDELDVKSIIWVGAFTDEIYTYNGYEKIRTIESKTKFRSYTFEKDGKLVNVITEHNKDKMYALHRIFPGKFPENTPEYKIDNEFSSTPLLSLGNAIIKSIQFKN